MFSFSMLQASVPRDLLAREIAERSVPDTLRQIGAAAEKMSTAELRGYVYAHAMPYVFEEAIQLVGRELPRGDFRRLIAAAVEQTTHVVVRQFLTHPVTATPAPHIRLRIAV